MAIGAVAAYGGTNFALDCALLFMAARLGGERIGSRLLRAALVGTLYAFLPGAWNGGLGGLLLCGFAMVLVAWGFARPPVVLRRLALLLAAAVLLGGAVLGAAAVAGLDLPSAAHPAPFAGLAAAAGAVVVVERLTVAWRLGRSGRAGLMLEVEVDGAHARLRGFVDTGNRLRDPLGRAPVVVAEAAPLALLLPAPARAAYLREAAAGLMPDRLASLCPAWAHRLTVVPYRAVGGAGVLTAIRPDALWAVVDGGRIAVRGLVALAPEPIGWSGADALVPPELVPAKPSMIGA
jgi:stage II sporulation protein GA (sporulation sigma-E factor processing peptidase)